MWTGKRLAPNKRQDTAVGNLIASVRTGSVLGSLGAPCEPGIGLLMDPSLPSGWGAGRRARGWHSTKPSRKPDSVRS